MSYNIRRNTFKLHYEDNVGVTYKLHGTFFIVSNIMVKRSLGLIEKVLKILGVKVQDTKYDFLYCSRKVVKNKFYNDK